MHHCRLDLDGKNAPRGGQKVPLHITNMGMASLLTTIHSEVISAALSPLSPVSSPPTVIRPAASFRMTTSVPGGADIGPDIDIPRHVEPVDSETFETANVEAPHGPLSCDPVEFGRAKNGRTIEVGPDVGIGMNHPECDEVSGLRRGWSEGRKLAGRISARSAATDMAARTCAANPAYPSDVRCAGLDDGRMSAIGG